MNKLTHVIHSLERRVIETDRYGGQACNLCHAGSYGEIVHTDGCPIGDLWAIANAWFISKWGSL